MAQFYGYALLPEQVLFQGLDIFQPENPAYVWYTQEIVVLGTPVRIQLEGVLRKDIGQKLVKADALVQVDILCTLYSANDSPGVQ